MSFKCKKLVCVLLAVITVLALTSVVAFAEDAAADSAQVDSATDNAENDTIIEVILRGEGTTVERLIHGGQVTLIGMIIVFAVLIVLMIILYIFPIIFGRKTVKATEASVEKTVSAPAQVNKSVPVNVHEVVSAPSAQETELVAVATAAIAAARGESDCAFNVISITPIN